MRLIRNSDRPFHWGPYPLEVLARDPSLAAAEAARPRAERPAPVSNDALLARVARDYRDIFAKNAEEEPAAAHAPLPDDLARRAQDVKGFGFFMDAAMVGICEIPESAWLEGELPDSHSHAIVLMVEHGRVPEPENLAHSWVAPAVREPAEMRAAEISVVLARHVRMMGFAARADIVGHEKLDHARLAVLAGLAVREGDTLSNPYIGRGFSLAVISTDYPLETDTPLAAGARAGGFRYWWGRNGATSGRERRRRAKRRSDLSRYPMETVKRADKTTTLILEDEVPRVPKRAAFFERALQGDLGAKSQKERSRFSFKHPTSWGLLGVIRSLVPFQGGEPNADADTSRYTDPAANSRAIKALSYFLGADITGICEAKDYTWYSHKPDGEPIDPYHKYAVVMLIDQGFDTMEGASGDDWISGFCPVPDQRGQRCSANTAYASGRPGRAQPHRRTCAQSFPGAAHQDSGADHGHAARGGQAHRFRPADLLQQLSEMRAGMPVRRHPLRRQGDVQRLRNLEAGCGAVHPISPDQFEGRRLRALHEDLPHQQGGGCGWSAADPRRQLDGHQRHVAETGDGAVCGVAGRQDRQRHAQTVEEMVVRPRDHRQGDRGAKGRHQPAGY
jgi:hypothetical protein